MSEVTAETFDPNTLTKEQLLDEIAEIAIKLELTTRVLEKLYSDPQYKPAIDKVTEEALEEMRVSYESEGLELPIESPVNGEVIQS